MDHTIAREIAVSIDTANANRQNVLLEHGSHRASVGESENSMGVFFDAFLLNSAKNFLIGRGLGALASSRLSQVVSNVHQIFRKGAAIFFGSSQIGDF